MAVSYTHLDVYKRQRIDSNELDIDSLGVNLKEAQELIKFCRDKLYKADEEIKKMLDNNVSM